MCSHAGLFVHPSQGVKCHYIILIITKLRIILSWCWNCRACVHYVYTHTDKHLSTSGSKPDFYQVKTIFAWHLILARLDSRYVCFPVWRRSGQNCFKCHLPSAKQISLFSAATWRKQNIKSGLKVMFVVLLTFLSVGWQRLSLSFSALHLYYSCNTQGLKDYLEMFPVSPEKWTACHGHTYLRGNYSRQQVSASLFRIFAVKSHPRLSVRKEKI